MAKRIRKKNKIYNVVIIAVFFILAILGSYLIPKTNISLDDIPDYDGEPYVEINQNEPYFENIDWDQAPYEYYSDLDYLGRAQYAEAYIDESLFPTEKRGSIGMIKPSGWQTARYDGIVEGNYLYNRCHLIGYQLTAENANEKNLITGTRYLNVTGMLPWENEVHDYIEETGNPVMYRVTPVYEGRSLVASGVLMEAESEDSELKFCIYCYNVQPGIVIDYLDGTSYLE